jgi:hypothetical protein
MRLIDDRVFPGDARPAIRAPGEGRVHHHRLGHAARIVTPVEREVAAGGTHAIGKMGVTPDKPSGQRLGVRVDQELVRVETEAALRLVGAIYAIAITLHRHHVAHIAVPDVFGALRQRDTFQLAPALVIEQAELDLGGLRREQREIGAAAIPGGPQRIGRAGGQPTASARGRKKSQQVVE